MSPDIENSSLWLKENAPQGLLIDNNWIASVHGNAIEICDPSTEQVIASVPSATKEQVEQALQSAATAQITWGRISSWKRSEYLRSIAQIIRRDVDVYARVMTLEQGKPFEQAKGEVLASADQFDWNADEARRVYGRIVQAKTESDQIHIYRQPIGPVAAFAPWNFPMLLPARKISAALAAGCVVIAMPAIESPLSALMDAAARVRVMTPTGTDPVSETLRMTFESIRV